ncbi:Kelch repeat-containing protein, partial [Saccharospirillum mangrovi]
MSQLLCLFRVAVYPCFFCFALSFFCSTAFAEEPSFSAERPERFSGRAYASLVAFQDQLWLFGGTDDSGTDSANEIWSSPDGDIWTQIQIEAPGHKAVVFQNQLWLVNGFGGSVWSSKDGLEWQSQGAIGPGFVGRGSSRLVVSISSEGDERLWLIGGANFPHKFFNDVWAFDGSQWEEVVPSDSAHSYTGRRDHQVAFFLGRLWVIGGWTEDGVFNNDVWSSIDGKEWRLETAHAEFSVRREHQVVVFNDGSGEQLWLIGGIGDGGLKDVWSSHDGTHWVLRQAETQYPFRTGHAVAVFDSQLWVVGGDDLLEYFDDVWSSRNGTDWQSH